MDDFLWETEEELATNEIAMHDYIDNHMPDDWNVLMHDGTYAEVETDECFVYSVSASGNGDFRNHKVEFTYLTGGEESI